MIKYILAFILGFITYIVSYKLIKQVFDKSGKGLKIEKAICGEFLRCTLQLPPSIVPKDKEIVVRHNLSLHTLDKKDLGNLRRPRGKDILFEKYCPGNENEDKTLLVATKIVWEKCDYNIEKGVKFIFIYEDNYYLGEVISYQHIRSWDMSYDGPSKITIPISIVGVPGTKLDVRLSGIVARVKEIFADWHYE